MCSTFGNLNVDIKSNEAPHLSPIENIFFKLKATTLALTGFDLTTHLCAPISNPQAETILRHTYVHRPRRHYNFLLYVNVSLAVLYVESDRTSTSVV
jgi:hypothetical protein